MEVVVQGKRIKLPDFLIVGAAKSGTTSLYHYLKQHPQIFLPSRKEIGFFLTVNNPSIGGVKDIFEYSKYFEHAPTDKVIGEIHPSYLYKDAVDDVIKNIKQYHPGYRNLKIIIILRNPIERAFSHYLMNLEGGENLSFIEACKAWERRKKAGWWIGYDIIGYSYYYSPVKAYLNNFNHVRIYFYEDLKANPIQLIKDIFSFLGVDTDFTPSNIHAIYRKSSGIPKSKIRWNLYVFTFQIAHVIHRFLRRNPVIRKIIFKTIPYDTRQKLLGYFLYRIPLTLKKHVFSGKKPKLTLEDKESLLSILREDIIKLQDLIKRDLSNWLK